MIATTGPWPLTSVAMTKAAIDATVPTDRSMPPVSIARVWQPARIARGTAARRVTPTHAAPTVPGAASSRATTRSPSRIVSGISGLSRRSRFHAAAVSHGLRLAAWAGAVMPVLAGA